MRTQFRAIRLQAQAMCTSGLRLIEAKGWAQGQRRSSENILSNGIWLKASLHVGIARVKPCPVLRQVRRLMN